MIHDPGLGPNAHLVGIPGSRAQLATPALLLDLDMLERNVELMAQYCRTSGIKLRPHAKSHKSCRIARMQIGAGAIGVCVATVREAAALLKGGINSIHLTSPVAGATKLDAFARLINPGAALSAVVDSPESLRALEGSVAQCGKTLPVLIDLDLGAMYRTGAADTAAAVELVRLVTASRVLNYAGVQFYSGVVQHIGSSAERARIYGGQLAKLAAALNALSDAGLSPAIVSGGGTGTIHIDAESGLMTENQAGSYCVMDVEYGEVELLPSLSNPLRSALFVQSGVISNNVPGFVTVDAGAKVLPADGPAPRVNSGAPIGASYHTFGDEFGMILSAEAGAHLQRLSQQEGAQAGAGNAFDRFQAAFRNCPGPAKFLELGAKVELVAPHCDPTVNLHDLYHCVRGNTLVDIWPVDARGSL